MTDDNLSHKFISFGVLSVVFWVFFKPGKLKSCVFDGRQTENISAFEAL